MVNRDIFEIRGNITHYLKYIEQQMKEREEREKAEREAKWAKEREEREFLDNEWKRNHPILDKFTYMNRYNYEHYSWPGELYNIRFYEWSDINVKPRLFAYSIAFYKFLDECKINLTEEQNNKLKFNKDCHITCIPGTHNLIVGTSYDDLKSQFNTSNVISSVPDLLSNSNNNSSCKMLPCCAHNGQ